MNIKQSKKQNENREKTLKDNSAKNLKDKTTESLKDAAVASIEDKAVENLKYTRAENSENTLGENPAQVKTILARKTWGAIPNAPQGHSWESLMHEALNQAKLGEVHGEIPVGALVVHKNGQILAKAHNKSIANSDPTAHAEIVALREAATSMQNYRLMDCYLVVTLEPCLMCTGAIREARLAGIIYGAYDSKAGCISSCLDGLHFANINIATWSLGGICSEECRDILVNFFNTKR